jgi:FkbH-like protein
MSKPDSLLRARLAALREGSRTIRDSITRLARGATDRLASPPTGHEPSVIAHAPAPAPGSTPQLSPELVARHNGPRFRTPTDLAVSPTPLGRVLVLGSCLASGWPDVIRAETPGAEADYVLFNNASELPAAPPHAASEYDLQLVQLPLRSVLPDHIYLRLPYQDLGAWEAAFAHSEQRLDQLLDAGLRWNVEHGLFTLVTNFLPPQQNPLGVLMPRYDLRNLQHYVERLNMSLAARLAKLRNAHLLDIDAIACTFGRKFVRDDAIWISSHGGAIGDWDVEHDRERIHPSPPVSAHYEIRSDDFMSAVWAEALASLRVARQVDTVKVVAVDLDDTLWRGVLAERGHSTDTTVEGWPLGLVEALNFLKKRGVLLAIASKNDPARIEALWDDVMLGRLLLEDFAIKKIGWNSKAESLGAIIREANVLPRSVVFVDDNPVERSAVSSEFPDVRVIGSDHYYMRRVLLWSPETQVAHITDESARRTEMIQAQVEREAVRTRLSRPEFLASLKLKVRLIDVTGPAHASFARAFELLNKTNQFNTNGRRWTQKELADALEGGLSILAFDVEDRFSKYGLVGVALIRGGEIVQFVMSCRVLGLDVERAVMGEIARRVAARGHDALAASIVETDANGPCRDLYARCGFAAEEGGRWRTRELAPPLVEHVELRR